MSDYTKMDDQALALALVRAEATGKDEETLLLLNEIAGRLNLPLDHTEQGLTPWASEQIDAFVGRALDEHSVSFATLHTDGSVTDERQIRQSVIRQCPHVILSADHYRTDGSCRCDDPEHSQMAEWGYTWKDGQWR